MTAYSIKTRLNCFGKSYRPGDIVDGSQLENWAKGGSFSSEVGEPQPMPEPNEPLTEEPDGNTATEQELPG